MRALARRQPRPRRTRMRDPCPAEPNPCPAELCRWAAQTGAAAPALPPCRAQATLRLAGRKRNDLAHEHIGALHYPAGGDDAAGLRRASRRRHGLHASVRLALAAGRFSDHPGDDAASRRQSRHDRVAGDGLARTAIRANPVALDHVVAERVRILADHAAIRSRPRHRRGRAGRAIGDQRRRLDAAAQPALSARLREGQSGGHADRHADAALANLDLAGDERSRRHAARAAAVGSPRRRPRDG